MKDNLYACPSSTSLPTFLLNVYKSMSVMFLYNREKKNMFYIYQTTISMGRHSKSRIPKRVSSKSKSPKRRRPSPTRVYRSGDGPGNTGKFYAEMDTRVKEIEEALATLNIKFTSMKTHYNSARSVGAGEPDGAKQVISVDAQPSSAPTPVTGNGRPGQGPSRVEVLSPPQPLQFTPGSE
jgi:hypothetical protein